MENKNNLITYLYFCHNEYSKLSDKQIADYIQPSLENLVSFNACSQILVVGIENNENKTEFLVWGTTISNIEKELKVNVLDVLDDLSGDGSTDFERGIIETITLVNKLVPIYEKIEC